MSSLKDELMRLSNTAPKLKGSDDEDDSGDDQQTRAKLEPHLAEGDEKDQEETVDNRSRIKPSANNLSDYGTRYKGQKVDRKDLNEWDDEEEEEVENDEKEDEIELDEESDDDEDDEIKEEEDDSLQEDLKPPTKSKSAKKETKNEDDDGEENKLNLINLNQKMEIEKGKCVKRQLNIWDMLLESRIKMQNVLSSVNSLPQFDSFEQLRQNMTKSFRQKNDAVVKQNKAYVSKAFNQLVELQQRLLLSDPETSYIIKELQNKNQNQNQQSSDKKQQKNDNTKRKRETDEDEDEELDDEEEEDEIGDDDEEIYSDTDDEMNAQARKSEASAKKRAKFEFVKLKSEEFEPYLATMNKSMQKYRNACIQKWYDKTRLITGKSFATVEKPIVQQIQQILMDKDRIIKRTQLKRGIYDIVGKPEETDEQRQKRILAQQASQHMQLIGNENQTLKDYDAEVFDDQDFYNQLLRELIDRKSSNVSDPVELSRKAIELQQLRIRNKKKVDTKASKGRKIKFETHKPMVNFMAPIYRTTMHDIAKTELFGSLFGNHATLTETSASEAVTGKTENSGDFKLI